MYNKLRDGPPDNVYVHLPLGPRNTDTNQSMKRTVHATLAALQWAAERANLSYGVFTMNLSPADQSRIQAEYEAYQQERKNELTARPRVNIGAVDKEINE